MSDAELQQLAKNAGIQTTWDDVFGATHHVAPPTLRAVLTSLGYATATESDVADGLKHLSQPAATLPKLVTAQAGHVITLGAPPARYRLVLEDGRSFDGFAEPGHTGSTIPPILEPGYHALSLGDQQTTIAVAPKTCFTVRQVVPSGRAWGVAVQLYSLRRKGDAGVGDFKALADFVRGAARHGVQAVAISPVHAQFSADPDRFSPYAPSSRVALNVLHAAVDGEPPPDPGGQSTARALEDYTLVDWPGVARARMDRLRSIAAQARGDLDQMQEFHEFRRHRGEVLELHARFEALHAFFFKQNPKFWHWRSWPRVYHDPARREVAAFAREYQRQVDFHAYVQFLADRGLQEAQAAARESGMPIGLIADLAVGADSGGSHFWARQKEMLSGLSIGAPPDLFQTSGQNWGLAAFSPRGLAANGFGAFLEMLRVSLAHAGGVRIDHAMGLNRLWVVPDGATASDGAYISFPEQDLRRLLALESHRHRAIVVAEDLGTVPEGYTDRLALTGIDGMRVLWFERDQQQNFTRPFTWSTQAAAMTTTHDLPTVAGWWRARDIEWRAQLEFSPDPVAEVVERATDRQKLWAAFQASGAATGDMPQPADTEAAVDAACAHVASSACELAIIPIEDVLGLDEQPNLPNTTNQHPNWRRRLEGEAATILDADIPAARLRAIASARRMA
jgi:4-alpha-glucanotransferase